MQYNLCNEPWLKYGLSLVTDRGLDPKLWTSYRLRSEVLFLEGRTQRFELSRVPSLPAAATAAVALVGGGGGSGKLSSVPDRYCFKACTAPLEGRQLRELGVPLQPPHVKDLSGPLEWEEFGFCTDGLMVQGNYYALERLCWMPTSTSGSESDASESDAEDVGDDERGASSLEEDIEGKDELDDKPKDGEGLDLGAGGSDSSDAEDGDGKGSGKVAAKNASSDNDEGEEEKPDHSRAFFAERGGEQFAGDDYGSEEEDEEEEEAHGHAEVDDDDEDDDGEEDEEEALDEDDLDLEPLVEDEDMEVDED